MAYPDCECGRYNHTMQWCVCQWDEAIAEASKPKPLKKPIYIVSRKMKADIERIYGTSN